MADPRKITRTYWCLASLLTSICGFVALMGLTAPAYAQGSRPTPIDRKALPSALTREIQEAFKSNPSANSIEISALSPGLQELIYQAARDLIRTEIGGRICTEILHRDPRAIALHFGLIDLAMGVGGHALNPIVQLDLKRAKTLADACPGSQSPLRQIFGLGAHPKRNAFGQPYASFIPPKMSPDMRQFKLTIVRRENPYALRAWTDSFNITNFYVDLAQFTYASFFIDYVHEHAVYFDPFSAFDSLDIFTTNLFHKENPTYCNRAQPPFLCEKVEISATTTADGLLVPPEFAFMANIELGQTLSALRALRLEEQVLRDLQSQGLLSLLPVRHYALRDFSEKTCQKHLMKSVLEMTPTFQWFRENFMNGMAGMASGGFEHWGKIVLLSHHKGISLMKAGHIVLASDLATLFATNLNVNGRPQAACSYLTAPRISGNGISITKGPRPRIITSRQAEDRVDEVLQSYRLNRPNLDTQDLMNFLQDSESLSQKVLNTERESKDLTPTTPDFWKSNGLGERQ